MKKIYAILMLGLAGFLTLSPSLSPCVNAANLNSIAPKAGPLDGAAGPSLPAVATPESLNLSPNTVAVEDLPGSYKAADFLYENGDFRGAATVWQMQAFKDVGQERADALLQAGRALSYADDDKAAFSVLSTNFDDAGDLSEKYLFAMAAVAPEDHWHDVIALLKKARTTENEGWLLAAKQLMVARQSTQHAYVDDLGLGLKPAQPTIPLAEVEATAKKAGWMSMAVPGLGLLWLGDMHSGFAMFGIWALLMIATYWYAKHEQWPLVLVWATFTVAAWLGAALGAEDTAKRFTVQEVQGNMTAVLPAWVKNDDVLALLDREEAPDNVQKATPKAAPATSENKASQ